MQDLNDLYFFAKVVESGGFAAAGRSLRQPKSKLSRRVAQLETELGVRLIERSTRRFRVTDVGAAFYDRCKTILIDVEQAQALTAEARSEPHGLVRLSCPTGLVSAIIRFLPELLRRHPRVRLQLVATNRRIDLIDERIDVALRVRATLDTDAELSVRVLRKSSLLLVAAPEWAEHLGEAPDLSVLAEVPTLSPTDETGEVTWELFGDDGATQSIRHEPRFSSGDVVALSEAAATGLGVAFLPDLVCAPALKAGRLVRVFPAWHGVEATMHLVFTTRRGLPPAVRALIDHLVEHVGAEDFGA
jgi:DNA-binding transcriptional LysR family regulator